MADADRVKWDARYRERTRVGEPSAVVVGLADRLPRVGRAIDIAGGAGRHALWMARRGLEVTLCDVSPVGLAMARAAADAEGLALDTRQVDLERDAAVVTEGQWDVALCFHYLQRSLLAAMAGALAVGGVFVLVHPTMRNLERHARPSARFLLQEGEAPGLVPGLVVQQYAEQWSAEERHEAVLVARREA